MSAPRSHTLLIVEDHALMREGLRALLESWPGFEVVGEASDGQEGIRRAEALQPDLILLDLSMPGTNGIEALRELKRVSEGSRVIVVTAHKDEEHIFAALAHGADGYFLKDSDSDELRTALDSLVAGERFLSPAIATKVVARYLVREAPQEPSMYEVLSGREREILKLVAEGKRSKDIGSYLGISPKTVERHRSNLMKRLGLHSVAALTSYAMSKGLLEP